ncbi:MAG: TIGR00269 family protein [Candidatus Aenigmarchaeota archaeon]|nr:TIGR00269 family protein [Candidatus Aenigmarchaeota archaeon]
MDYNNSKCKCGREAVFLRINEGAHYCGSCLTRQVERNFQKTISKGKMLEKNDVVAVGVSGGKDSMVLLHLMNKLSKKLPMKLIAVTIDEGIAGYRDRSINFVKQFANDLGIEQRTFSFNNELDVSIDNLVKNDPKVKTCTYCGVFRRSLLNKAGREVGADKVAVGHNLDDEAQSVLMNVMRGDMKRMARLSKISERFVRRIKPLKNMPEKEIVAYAIINNIPYFDGECPNSFNNARRDVQTMLNDMEQKYPGTKNNIINFYRKLPAIPIETSPMACTKCGEPSSHEVCKACELLEKAKGIIK